MLTNLQDLQLFQNNLTGEIPVSIWKIQTLQYVHLYMNNLTGELPLEMTELKQLKNITLYNNQFYGVVPQALGINSSLVRVDFMYNKFTGSIPPNLCFGKQLSVLNMGFNQFQGTIPSDVGSCSTLWRMRLGRNNLTGVLPQFVKNSGLSYMDISSNEISGEIPASLGNCSSLTTIILSMNNLTGVIPEELGYLADLQNLNLSHNNLVGALPSSLSNCTKMQEFDVGFNFLNGSIPLSLSRWTGLSKLVLSENRFTGSIPPFLSEFEKLSELQLGGNLLGGVIPSSVGALQNLFYALNLSNNALTGDVPSDIGKLMMLQRLDLSHNNLTGSLRVLDGMKSLIEVNVSFNGFTGAVPETLMNLLNSSSFSFSSNLSLCVSYLPSCGYTCAGNNTIKLCNSPSSKPKGLSKVGIAFIAVGSSILAVSLLYLLVYLFCLSRRTKKELGVSDREGPSSLLTKVMEATENLNDRYIIGRGAHGTVYRASLDDDEDFAVKKLVFAGHEGTRLSMMRELQTLGKIKHRNLVKLEDFWLRKDYGLILYRYMQNGSLHDVLHEISPPLILEWSVRYKIALGTAYALEYLHYDCVPPIVHRDIKPMNILLDSEMEAHISDFGIAKLLDQSTPSMMSISVVGTTGYIAPENAFRTANSVESDVYSFGVVLLELITRRKALDPSFMEQTDIVGWVRSVWSDTEKIDRIVDSSIMEELLESSIRDQIVDVFLVALSYGLALLSLLNRWTFVPTPISSSWNLSDSTPCKWVGIECDTAQNVFALNVSSYGISGLLGPEIGNLGHLQTLILSVYSFSGQIPMELANCSLLETLDLSGNGFTGKLPDNLHKLKNLQYLGLYDNFLDGQIPVSLFTIPNLAFVYLYNNSLNGSIPGKNCKKLFFLDLSYNKFRGSLPSALGNCTGLMSFMAISNNLVGSIPSSFGLLDKLELLYLPVNQLSGRIPPELGQCKSLTGLQLNMNQLVGEIPDELGMLDNLQDLRLSQNNLTGEVPVSIWKIQTLQYVHLYMNNLTGEHKQLKNISLFNNQFYGVIPQALGINSSLELIDFMYNMFTGSIPPNLCFGKKLMVLVMGCNQLQGTIPSYVGGCSTLSRLRLEQNNLTGVLPLFVKNSELSYMDISSNEISGEIQSSLGNCRSLTTIILSMNKLTGVIPEKLGYLADLQTLDLSDNNLVGALPSSLSNCTKMEHFNVASNFLNGSIPSSLSSWTGLSELVLSDNKFTGGIPPFLSEFEKLSELQLGGNLLGGVIPSSVGALQNLFYALNLSNNALTGDVPSDIGKLMMLQRLDLSHNNLTGSLRVLDGMKSLIEVNVSFNGFTGAVPETLMNLLNSSTFSFSGNPSLCVSYLPSCGLTCAGNNTIRLCKSQSSKQKGLGKIAFIALGSSILAVSLLYLLVYLFCLSRRTKQEVGVSAREGPSSLLTKVMEATEDLNDRYIIGRGSHGTVYRASLDEDKDFAVKKLVFAGHAGRRLSMIRELQTLGKIKHRNLVKLEDFWLRKDYGLMLYRYMQNGSLHDVLHEISPRLILEWSMRYNIALGTAYGLEYLHYDYQSTPSMVSISVVGTTGYIAPENAFRTANSVESDVYSYGVVLLELITRKKALDPSFMEPTDIVGWVRSVWRDTERIDRIVDSSLVEELLDSNIRNQIVDVLLLALSCSHDDPKKRPTMRDVIKILLEINSPMRSTMF
ncbi:hypothetical protein ACLB2K_067129 [Fragaria x ananassa]